MRVRDVAVVAACVLTGIAALAGEDDEDAPAPTGPLTRVVTVLRAEDETPVAGATVEAVGLPGGTLKKTTGADGVAKFPDMPRDGVTFVARLDGRFPAWHEPGGFAWSWSEEDHDDDGDGVTSMTFGLAKGTVFEGRVVAKDDGSPISGATVVAEQITFATDQFELDAAPTWTAITDAEGRFSTASHFPAAYRNESVHALVTARAPGWISEHVDVKPHGAKSAAFRLLRAARLRGVVTGVDGKPATGAVVHAYPSDFGMFHRGAPDDMRSDEDEHPRVLETVTDAQGHYEMPELHPGVKFFVYAERYERTDDDFGRGELVARSAVSADVGTAAAGEEAVADLRLRVLASLVVHVAPDAGGAAKDLGVDLVAAPGSFPSIDGSDLEGGREFVHLDPGPHALHVRAAGWLPLRRTVDVRAGERVELTVRLEKGSELGGIVVDDLGAPVADVVVYAYPVDPSSGRLVASEGHSAKSSTAGAFRIGGLPPGPVDIAARDDRHVPSDYVRVTAPSSDVRLVVVRRPFISLRVDAPPGASLPKEVLATVKTLTGRYAGLRDPMHVPSADLPAKLDRLRPGPVDITVDIGSFAPSTLHVDLKPGETTPVGPFAFEEGVTLSGRVVDASGRPVAGARVTPYENDARTTTTAADGSFTLPHLAPGRTEIAVVSDGLPETHLVATAAADAAAVIFTSRPGGVVRGKVKSRDGDRVERRRLCIYDAADTDGYGPHWHGEVGKEAQFSLRLPAGKYRFVPSRYEFAEGAVLFEVTEGGTTDVAFELP